MGVKVLQFKNPKERKLPEFSNTSDAYILLDRFGKPKQLRIYEDRRPKFDVDFDHSHHHGLSVGQYHIHDHTPGNKGFSRSLTSRPLTSQEWKKWGKLIEELARLRNV